jgi:AraC family transcriptional regulator of adaptative response/methylated-DNA-[protein]-cysteine methyltransferase
MQIFYTKADTSLGTLMLAATERGICFLQLTDDAKGFFKDISKKYPKAEILSVSGKYKKQFTNWLSAIKAYLSGKQDFPELPLDVKGTNFQLKIWKQLQKIPAGKLKSYREIAKAAGMPKAVRAVANACARNNVALVIPCHRVIRSDGSLSGYRWGVKRKQALIDLEKKAG